MARGGASLIRIMIEAVDTATKLNNSATYGGNRGLSVKTPQRRMNSSHLKGATRLLQPFPRCARTWNGEEFTPVKYLEPYKGYWVLVLEDTVLDMEKSKPA